MLTDKDNAEVILFTLVIGALIATVEASGGVRGFVARLEEKRWVDTPRRAGILVFLIGVLIFIESNITILIGGAVVTEIVFNIPGLGRLIISAILRRDYPVVQGVVLVTATAYVLINLAVDLVYAFIDPRIRYE